MKHIANLSLSEFKEMFEEIPYYIVEIVYDYYHRDRRYTIDIFANKHHVSVATLYRYIEKVRKAYERQ